MRAAQNYAPKINNTGLAIDACKYFDEVWVSACKTYVLLQTGGKTCKDQKNSTKF